jgi:hypothetical protein
MLPRIEITSPEASVLPGLLSSGANKTPLTSGKIAPTGFSIKNGIAYAGTPDVYGKGVMVGFVSYDALAHLLATQGYWQIAMPGWKFTEGFVACVNSRLMGFAVVRPDMASDMVGQLQTNGIAMQGGAGFPFPNQLYSGLAYGIVATKKDPITTWFSLASWCKVKG